MTTKIKNESFIGKYLPYEPIAELPEGSIVDGWNYLRKGIYGGWTPRKGYTLINTTSGWTPISSFHRYKNPYFGDFHLFAQISINLYGLDRATDVLTTNDGEVLTTNMGESLLVSLAAAPLSQRTTLGSSIFDVGSNKAFSCMVGEDFILCDGSQRPVIYGGDAPRCDGFIVYEGATGTYIDYTEQVNDGDTTTFAVITANASTKYFVGMKEKGTEIHLIFDTVNTNAVTAVVKAFRSGAWADASATDGTSDGTNTHAEDGEITWASSANDSMTQIGNRQLYWYEVSFSGAPTEIKITSCRIAWAMSLMTTKWDGVFHYVEAALFYDASVPQYVDKLGAVTDDSQSTYMDVSLMQTGDYIYFKTLEPLLGIGFKMVEGSPNSANAQFDLLECITSAGWATVGAITDTTLDAAADSSLAVDGTVWVVNTHTPQLAVFQGDEQAAYWYRISADAALSADVKISEMVYAAWPKALHPFDGCVEFDGRLVLWGETHHNNRLLVSPYNAPDQLAFHDELYTFPFGGSDSILNCVPLGDYLVVWKRESTFLANRDFSEKTMLSARVGLASPHTAVVISSGDRSVKEDETKTIIMWQDRDGIYKATESLQITKVSDQIRNYFLPDKTDYVGDENINNLSAFYHKPTDTYRLILPDRVLCYHIGTNEWTPPWYYELTISAGFYGLGPSDESMTLLGTSEGFILEAEKVISDRGIGNDEVAISHRLTTRPVFLADDSAYAMSGVLRHLWINFLPDSGEYALAVAPNRDMASRETLSTPSAPTLTADGEGAIQKFDLSMENIYCFQLRFYSNTLDQVMELYGFNYLTDSLRLTQ